MRIFDLGDINSDKGKNIPPATDGKRWIAFAFGPDSLIDAVKIDGVTLAVGGVVPCSTLTPNVERVRGPRTGDLPDPRHQVVTRCQLIGYESGDDVPSVAPLRAPHVAFYETGDAAELYTRVLRLPFSGRKYASVAMRGEVGVSFDWAIVGIKYHPHNSGESSPPHEAPLDDGTHVPDASAVTGELESLVKYVGGVPIEDFDEIELWYRNAAGGDFKALAKAWD